MGFGFNIVGRIRTAYETAHQLTRGVEIERGGCTYCNRKTVFVHGSPFPRESPYCLRCRSVPRSRALFAVLEIQFPAWRNLRIHESSPSQSALRKFSAEAPGYVPTFFVSGIPAGGRLAQGTCENLEQQSFADESFDIVITQDVFEHILRPEKAFAEVARTLKVGGAHIFTVPRTAGALLRKRAIPNPDGSVRHLLPPEFHGDPADPASPLVVTEWGDDLLDTCSFSGGTSTEVVRLCDPSLPGSEEALEIFISRKG